MTNQHPTESGGSTEKVVASDNSSPIKAESVEASKPANDQPGCSKCEMAILWLFIAGMFLASAFAFYWLWLKLNIQSG